MTCLPCIKLVWATFGLNFCLSPVKVNGLPSNVNVCLNASFNNINFSTHEVFKSEIVPEPGTVFGSLAFSTLLAVRELRRCKKLSKRT